MSASVLSDGTIRRLVREGRIRIDPWDAEMVQPASVDLKLGRSFRVFHNFRVSAIDLANPPTNLTEHQEVGEGESFVIHPGEFVLGRTEEWVELPDDLVARIEGKALALDTPVPTPGGWRTMGDLRVGDEVLDADGEPVAVVAATEPMAERPCREVRFSDGATVVADLAHRWEVSTADEPRRIVTTADLEAEPGAYGVAGAPPAAPAPRGSAAARSVVAVREVASVPVRCIEVGSARGVFLVTRSLVPTHNSSLGRLGLIVHATAGFVDPGWRGTLTLEITNLTRVPIVLWPGKPVAQLSFIALDRPAERPYGHPELGSHYTGQVDATESRYEGGPRRSSSR